MSLDEYVCRPHIHDTDVRAAVHPFDLTAPKPQPVCFPHQEWGIVCPVREFSLVGEPSHLGFRVEFDLGVIQHELKGEKRHTGGHPAPAMGIDLLFRLDAQIGHHSPDFFR